MKKINLVIAMILMSIGMLYSQGLNTQKGHIGFEADIIASYATGLNKMNTFLKPSYADFKDMRIFQGGIGLKVGYFVMDNFDVYVKLALLNGKDKQAKDNILASATTIDGLLGVEYYFFKKNMTRLSANVAIGKENIDFCYGSCSGYWRNFVMDIGLTYWLGNMAIGLNYTPAIIKQKVKHTTLDLPKMSMNNISLNLRFKF